MLTHHIEMKIYLYGLREEIHLLSSRVAALEVSSTSTEMVNLRGSGPGAPTDRKRIRCTRGSKANGHGSW